jgi:hypothetical protein
MTVQNLGFSQKDLMLLLHQGHLVDVVHESPYACVLTVRASTSSALKGFLAATSSEIVQVPHHIYTFIVHVHEDQFPVTLSHQLSKGIEVVDRMTPEPACFIYEYCYESDDESNIGDYGYCWPDEVDSTKDYLMSGDKNLIGEPVFLPLFRIPGELVNAPLTSLEGYFNTSSDEDLNDNQTDS